MEYKKVKSAAKRVRTRGPELTDLILRTMRTCSMIVGDTLGPGGRPVLIERFEHALPPTVTKDGVTVFRSIGFQGDEQVIMEAARDCSVRTAQSAGDGTTTATILAEAIVRNTMAYCKANPRVSPQRVVEKLRKCWQNKLEPDLLTLSTKVGLTDPEQVKHLWAVAKVSGNGDEELADAVMKCYLECGDEGNVTIVEGAGNNSGYPVERIEGYPIPTGYDRCCGPFAPEFVNDSVAQRSWMPEPVFIVYNGKLNDMQTIFPLLQKIGEAWAMNSFNFNVVVAANSFSENVLAHFALNYKSPNGLKIFPLLAPLSPISNGQHEFLQDIAAVAGVIPFDPVTRPLEQGQLSDLGPIFEDEGGRSLKVRGCEAFEAGRFTSNILGRASEERVLLRIKDVRAQLERADSEMERIIIQERLAKLTGGIARLKVIGNSDGETKERRDRAEDAVCAVRGAIKHGVLPGGGWALMCLVQSAMEYGDTAVEEVMIPSLQEPVRRLLENAGLNKEEVASVIEDLLAGTAPVDGIPICVNPTSCYDASSHNWVNPWEAGLLDSTPAVMEAIRNALSIASLLGTLGGTVTFVRDGDLERKEAGLNEAWLRDGQTNEANERA